jgi:hypothetical protein
MHRFVGVLAVGVALLALPAESSAQQEGKVGVTMGFPGSIGLLWHATKTIAVRPELSFAWSSSESGTNESDTQSFTTGLSALFYLRKWDDLATYVSPRYAFARSTSTSDTSFAGDRETVSHSHLLSGSFGAQYWLGQRFSAFGEIGLSYQHGRVETDPVAGFILGSESSSNAFSTRSGVGVVFYF